MLAAASVVLAAAGCGGGGAQTPGGDVDPPVTYPLRSIQIAEMETPAVIMLYYPADSGISLVDQQLVAIGSDDEGHTWTIESGCSWSSSAESVATVSSSGLCSAAITAPADGQEWTFDVTVTKNGLTATRTFYLKAKSFVMQGWGPRTDVWIGTRPMAVVVISGDGIYNPAGPYMTQASYL